MTSDVTSARVGTRGSELALIQTRTACRRLRQIHPGVAIEEVVIATHGDRHATSIIDADWPAGGFTSAIEDAVLSGRVDFAVHSYKDLPSTPTGGLCVAAVPPRAAVHDVLVTRDAVNIDFLPRGFRIGTGSPRRAAQWRRMGDVEIRPVRGNVPTRLEKLQRGEVDALVLAAAGVDRLGVTLRHRVDLPVERFPPAPAQGALAVQTRADHPLRKVLQQLNDAQTARTVAAERSFLAHVAAGCQTAAAALARLDAERITLTGQLFDESGQIEVRGSETGSDPVQVGQQLAAKLQAAMQKATS